MTLVVTKLVNIHFYICNVSLPSHSEKSKYSTNSAKKARKVLHSWASTQNMCVCVFVCVCVYYVERSGMCGVCEVFILYVCVCVCVYFTAGLLHRLSYWGLYTRMKSSTQTQLLGLHTPSPDVGDGHGVKLCNHAGSKWLDSMRTSCSVYYNGESEG